MENMRRTLLQPTLRMSNGGNFFTRLVGGSDTGKKLSTRGAAIDAATNAAAPVPAPAPPPKPARTVADIRFKDGGSLRTGAGGHVPGKGEGDKIDALYEPGEFVVSNDMLDAAPELRNELSSLRGRVLAAKGMTPEQADAKAVSHTSLRAMDGFEEKPPKRTAFPTNYPPSGRVYGESQNPPPAAPVPPAAPIGDPGQIPNSAPAGWAGGVGERIQPQSDFSRNLQNTATAVSGLRGAAALGGLAGQTGKIAPVISKLVQGAQNTNAVVQGAVGAMQAGEAAPATAAVPTPTAAATPAPTGMPDGTSLRSPGVYETRRPGQAVEFGDQASLTDTGFRNRGAISAQNMAAADALDARGSAERAGLRQREQYNAEVAEAQAINARTLRGSQQGILKNKTQRQIDREREMDITEASGLRSNATTLRGQDLDAQGRAASQQTAAATSEAIRLENDRKYQLDVARLGVDEANKVRDNKRAGEAAFDKRVEGLVGTDKEGKPDARAASQVRNAANAYMADKLQAARTLLTKEPNNKSARAVVDDIERNGVGGIDDDTMRRFMLGTQANRVAQENDGWAINPFAGKSTNTSTPATSLRLQNNMFLPDKYVTDNGQKIPKSAVEANPDLLRLRTN